MDYVLDTVSMNHLTKTQNNDDDLTLRVRSRMIRLVVDKGLSLLDEWQRSANAEIVKALIAHWQEYGGLITTKKAPRLPRELAEALRKLGFRDTGDKLVVAIALMTTDRAIISSDSDFYDPSNKKSVGNCSGCVAKHLSEEEGIEVLTIKDVVRRHPVKRK